MSSVGVCVGLPLLSFEKAVFSSILMKLSEGDVISAYSWCDPSIRPKLLNSDFAKELLSKQPVIKEVFQQHIYERINISHHPFYLFSLFRLFLFDQIKLYKAVSCEELDGSLDLDDLMLQLASLRCTEEPNLFFNNVERYLKILEEKINSAGLPSDKITPNTVWSTWRTILAHPQFTNVSVACCVMQSTSKTLNIAPSELNECTLNIDPSDLSESFELIAGLLFNDIHRVIQRTEEIIINASKIDLNTDELRLSWKSNSIKMLIGINEIKSDLFLLEQDLSFKRKENVVGEALDKLYSWAAKVIKLIPDVRPSIRDLEKDAKTEEEKEKVRLNIDILEEIYKAHILFDTFVVDPLIELDNIYKNLKVNTAVFVFNKFLKDQELKKKFLLEEKIREANQVAESLIKESSVKSEKKKQKERVSRKKGKRKEGNLQAKSTIKQVEPVVVQANTVVEPKRTVSYATISKEVLLLNELLNRSSNVSNDVLYALKNARYHLSCLIVTQKLIEKTWFDPAHRLNLITALQGHAYYLIEQLLRVNMLTTLEGVDEDKFHGLKAYLNRLPQVYKTRAIADRLFLAYEWVRNPFDNFSRWSFSTVKTLQKPEVLDQIVRVALNPKDRELDTIPLALKKDYDDVLVFCNELLGIVDNSKTDERVNQDLVSSQFKINRLKLNELEGFYSGVVEKFGFNNESYLSRKLTQSRDKLLILSSTIDLLNEASEPDQFSMLAGRTVHYLYLVFEEELKTLYFVKNRVEASTHFLDLLWSSVFPSEPVPDIIQSSFMHLSRVSRYPFEEKKEKNALHRIVLEAVQLQEHPELDKGFSLVGQSKSISAEKIRRQLKDVLDAVIEISHEKVLPTLKTLYEK